MGFGKLNSEKNIPASEVLILNEFYTLAKIHLNLHYKINSNKSCEA